MELIASLFTENADFFGSHALFESLFRTFQGVKVSYKTTILTERELQKTYNAVLNIILPGKINV